MPTKTRQTIDENIVRDYFREVFKTSWRAAGKKFNLGKSTLWGYKERYKSIYLEVEAEIAEERKKNQNVVLTPALPVVLAADAVQEVRQFTDKDKEDFAKYEQTIRTGLTTFVEVGRSLFEIKNRGLHFLAQEDGKSLGWKEYCLSRWKFTDSHANRQIGAYNVEELLRENDESVDPCESQVRPLVPLLKRAQGKIGETWRKAEELAEKTPSKRVTAQLVAKAARDVVGDDVTGAKQSRGQKQLRKTMPKVIKDSLTEKIDLIVETFNKGDYPEWRLD